MYREQVVFKCPFTSSTFRSKSFTAIELEDGLSCYQFLGMPQPTLSKRRLMMHVVPKVHKVYRVEEVEEEKEKGNLKPSQDLNWKNI